MKRVFMIYKKEMPISFKNGKWHYETSEIEVRVLAIAEGYAMVRVKGGNTFAVQQKELFPIILKAGE